MAAAHVLLVEDDEDDIFLVTRAFRRAAKTLALDVARTGAEATARLGCAPLPALVLLDLRLPGESGFSVLEHMRGAPRTRFVPVIILSNSTLPSDRDRAMQLGANSYVQKPLDEATLDAIAHAVEAYWVRLHRQPRCDEP